MLIPSWLFASASRSSSQVSGRRSCNSVSELDESAGAGTGFGVAGLEELGSGVRNGCVAGNEVTTASLNKVIAVVASGRLDLDVLAVASSNSYRFRGGKLSRTSQSPRIP